MLDVPDQLAGSHGKQRSGASSGLQYFKVDTIQSLITFKKGIRPL
jgi:hypothetical protein